MLIITYVTYWGRWFYRYMSLLSETTQELKKNKNKYFWNGKSVKLLMCGASQCIDQHKMMETKLLKNLVNS